MLLYVSVCVCVFVTVCICWHLSVSWNYCLRFIQQWGRHIAFGIEYLSWRDDVLHTLEI